ncbi:hypothetical protein DFP72DRAFT_771013, partial [Ephemerocybe angulata]
QFLAFFFLRSLPASPTWDVFRTSVLNGSEKIEDLTFDTVSARAASQVANSISLTNNGSESALQASQRCAHHGPGTHSTDDCIPKGNRGRSGKQTSRSRHGKETAKVAEGKDDDEGDPGDSGDDEGDQEHVSHVYISDELKKQFRAYVSLPEPQRLSKRNETLFDSACSAHM